MGELTPYIPGLTILLRDLCYATFRLEDSPSVIAVMATRHKMLCMLYLFSLNY
jgi:hypothetical protein